MLGGAQAVTGVVVRPLPESAALPEETYAVTDVVGLAVGFERTWRDHVTPGSLLEAAMLEAVEKHRLHSTPPLSTDSAWKEVAPGLRGSGPGGGDATAATSSSLDTRAPVGSESGTAAAAAAEGDGLRLHQSDKSSAGYRGGFASGGRFYAVNEDGRQVSGVGPAVEAAGVLPS